MNAIFDTSNNYLMEVFAPIYIWGNCGLRESNRQTWDQAVSEQQGWAPIPQLPFIIGQISFTKIFCLEE